jgi:hypothetical protein
LRIFIENRRRKPRCSQRGGSRLPLLR